MVRLNVVSHNVWMIPFGGPNFLGKKYRAAAYVGQALESIGAEEFANCKDDVLDIIVMQELWVRFTYYFFMPFDASS
jgi:hypothetical protein